MKIKGGYQIIEGTATQNSGPGEEPIEYLFDEETTKKLIEYSKVSSDLKPLHLSLIIGGTKSIKLISTNIRKMIENAYEIKFDNQYTLNVSSIEGESFANLYYQPLE